MKTIMVPIVAARSKLCSLLKQVESGVQICLTSHGEPKALTIPFPKQVSPWREDMADDPPRYGDLQSPVMEKWE